MAEQILLETLEEATARAEQGFPLETLEEATSREGPPDQPGQISIPETPAQQPPTEQVGFDVQEPGQGLLLETFEEAASADPKGARPKIIENVDNIAVSKGVPPGIFRSLVKRESNFNPDARGALDEIGLTQIRPATFREVAPGGDIFSVSDNLNAGAVYLKRQHDTALAQGYTGREAWEFAAAAYNGGPGNLVRAQDRARKATGKEFPSFNDVASHLDKRAVAYAKDIGSSFDKDIAIDQKGGGLGEAGGFVLGLNDILKSAQGVLNFLADAVGDRNPNRKILGDAIGKLADENIASIKSQLSPEIVESLERPITKRKKEPVDFGDATLAPILDFVKNTILNPEFTVADLFRQTGRAAPLTVAAIVPGALATKAAVRFLSLGPTGQRIAGAVAFGTSEGALELGFAKNEISGAIMAAPEETIQTSAAYKIFLQDGLSPQEARQKLADTISNKAALKTGVATGLIGAPMGAFLAGILIKKHGRNRARDIMRGFFGEAAQEGIQERVGGEIASTALQEAGLAGLTQEQLNEATAKGAALGAVLGGATTGIVGLGGSDVIEQKARQADVAIELTLETGLPEIPPTTPAEPGIQAAPLLTPGAEPIPQPVPPVPAVPDVPLEEVIVPEAATIPSTLGRQANLKTVAGDKNVTYRLVEADNIITSHDPFTFAESPGFPQQIQERKYDQDKQAQLRVINQTRDFDPDFIVTDDPTPVNGPPIITPDGLVLGGNSRVMTLKRLYGEGRGDEFTDKLKAKATSFGLNPAKIDQFVNPILVRQVEDAPRNLRSLGAFGSDLNKPFTAALSDFEEAVSAGRRISRGTIDFIGNRLDALESERGTASIRELLNQLPTEIIDRLKADGVITEGQVSSLFDQRRGLLNEKGKNFIERALVGSIIDDPTLLSNIPPRILNKISSALPSLTRLKARGGEFDITNELKDAAQATIEATNQGLTADQFISQRGLFGDVGLAPRTQTIFESLMNDKAKDLKAKFKRFASAAAADVEGQATLFKKRTPEQAFRDAMQEIIRKKLEEAVAREEQPFSLETLEEAQEKEKKRERPKPKKAKRLVQPAQLTQEELLQDKQKEGKFLAFEGTKENLAGMTPNVDFPKGPTTKKRINKNQILQLIEAPFGVSIRGRVTHIMGNKAAWFEKKGGIIRLKQGRWGSVEIMTHELGHFVDLALQDSLGKAWKANVLPVEIRKNAVEELKSLDYERSKERISEGFAEFFRLYITNPVRAKELAPIYFTWFDKQFVNRTFIGPNSKMIIQGVPLLGETKRVARFPFIGGTPAVPKGFKPIKKPFNTLKEAFKTWYDQGSLERMMQNIAFDGEHQLGIRAKMRKGFRFVMREIYDSNHVFEEVTKIVEKARGKEIPPAKNPFKLATMQKAKSAAIVENMVRVAMFNPQGKRVGPSLIEVLEPANLNTRLKMMQFFTFAIARRAKTNELRGFETGFEIVDINNVIAQFEGTPGWVEAAEGLTKWHDQLLDWYVESGDLSPELKKFMTDLNPEYIPFKRMFENALSVVPGSGSFIRKGRPVQPLEGGVRLLRDPMEAIIENAIAVVSRSRKTKLLNVLIDMAKEEGMEGIIKEIPLASHVKKFKLSRIINASEILKKLNEALIAQGINLKAELEKVHKMKAQGNSNVQIAKELGVTVTTITNWEKNYGNRKPTSPPSPPKKKETPQAEFKHVWKGEVTDDSRIKQLMDQIAAKNAWIKKREAENMRLKINWADALLDNDKLTEENKKLTEENELLLESVENIPEILL